MRALRIVFLTIPLLATLAAAGCSDGQEGTPGTGFEIAVAPLSLPGIEDVCYTLEVRNDTGQTVWTRQHICASQYGDGLGDISFVGTCDAQDANTTDGGTALNTVTLTMEHIYTSPVDHDDYTAGAVADAEWVNPCGTDADAAPLAIHADGFGPCQITEPCVENQDTFIAFNVTVMRNAEQGFFDIAVNFEDIYCSAKLDCRSDSDDDGDVDADDAYIQLLHNGTTGRSDTVILALACTAGPDQDTHLYWTDVNVTCGGGYETLVDPSGGPGNLGVSDAHLFQAAVYRGNETLSEGGLPLNKRYWNIALGLEDPTGCTVTANATASNGAFTDGVTPAGTTYPYIHFEADLETCTAHPMGSAEVAERYTGLGTPEAFSSYFDGAVAGATAPPLRRCVELLAADPTLPDGDYTIDVDGDPATPNPTVYCDMSGGGWMRILDFDETTTTDVDPTPYLTQLSYFGDTTEIANADYLYADERGFGWGKKVDSGGVTPTPEQSACIELSSLPTLDALKLTVRSGDNVFHAYGYLHILEPGHDDEYAGWSDFSANIRPYFGFASVEDPWRDANQWNRVRRINLPGLGYTDVLPSTAQPNLDTAPFTFENTWPFDRVELCMVFENPNHVEHIYGIATYNRRYIQDVWVK